MSVPRRVKPKVLIRHSVAAAAFATAIAANGLVYALVVAPNRTALATAEAQWQSERQAIGHLKAYQQAHRDLTTTIGQATSRDDLPGLVATLAALPKKRHLSIPSVDYQPERFDSQDFQKIGLSFSIAGPYGQVRRFLDDLERLSPFIMIETLALTRSRKEGAELEVQLKVAAYLRTT